MIRMVSRSVPITCVCLILFMSLPAYSQWASDSVTNTAVCDTVGQQDIPRGCSDGANGAIFAWEDARFGIYQIYAQHIDKNGSPRWTRNGVRLAIEGNSAQNNPIVTTDDSGGAYVVWLDSRNSSANGTCLFAQHILANGMLAYPDTGLPVAIGLNSCLNPTLCDDGFGGAFVAWEDYRASIISARPDIWMNRLWPNSVKYGLTTTGTNGTISVVNNGHGVNDTFFLDPSANFESYLNNLHLIIPGKGSYLITAVVSDSQLSLRTWPPVLGTYTYYVGNMTGLAIDTFPQKQTAPAMIGDGNGGCFLAWITGATTPSAIYGTHLDSTCTAWWDPAPQPGFRLYQSSNTLSPSTNVSMNRDSNKLLLTWEEPNPNNNSQEVYAQRIRCNTLVDTTFEWGTANKAVNVTSNQILNQINPQIFSDDSSIQGVKGALVPFMDAEPGSSIDNFDIAMVRVLPNGNDLLPPAGNSFWFFEQKPHFHTDFQAVKITDRANAGTNTGLLTVWDDADPTGLTQDTMLYAQRIDRIGRKYFPTPGTRNTWGLAISGNSPTKKWSARQPCLVPRTDGAIVAWTDYRSGTGDIYAQLILMDGSLGTPVNPIVTVLSSTPPDNDSQCNSQCTTVLGVDTGVLKCGIESVTPAAMNNMKLGTSIFSSDADSVTFTVCVVDSFQNGTGTVNVEDSGLKVQSINFTYCTIADTTPPMIVIDTVTHNLLYIHFHDDGPWDRGLQSVSPSNFANVNFSGTGVKIPSGDSVFTDTVKVIDTSIPANFCIEAKDVAGNTSEIYCYTTSNSGVSPAANNQVTLSVFPNPISGNATVWLDGAPEADVTVLDVLGRTVDQFHLAGSHEWDASMRTAGTYLVRAHIGDLVICKRIIRE